MARITAKEQAYRDGYEFARESLGTERDWSGEHIAEFRAGWDAGERARIAAEHREECGMFGDTADAFDFGGVADYGCRFEE